MNYENACVTKLFLASVFDWAQLVGMTELEVKTFAEMMQQLESGSQGRTTGATAMNNQSSRSHAIFTIYLERKSKRDRSGASRLSSGP